MSKAFKYFITRSYTIFILSFFVFSFSILKVSAVYYATDNVTNPSCAPGDAGCYVSLNTLDQNIRIWNATGHDTTSVGIGTLALDTITGTDNYNYAIGEESMRYATGSGNYGFGWYTLRGDGTNTNSGSRNIGIGEGVLNKLRSGSDNIGIGNAAFNALTTGSFNISIGRSSQRFLTTGSHNTSLGYGSLINNIIGSGNTTFGYNSATSATGSYNTIIGYGGGQTLSTGSYNISIGQNVQLPSDTGSGQLNIGNLIYGTGIYSGATATSTPVTSGMIGIGVATPTATLDVLYDSTTDERMTFGGAGRLNIIRYGSDQAIRIQRANGTSASQTHVLLGENIGQFGFEGYRANASFGRTFDISIQASEDYSGSSYGSTASFLKVKTSGSSRYPYMYTDGNNRTGFTSGSSGLSGTIPSTLYALGEGSTSSTYTAQFHNSTGTNNALVIRDDGNVGIGTASPNAKLHVLYNPTNSNSDLFVSESSSITTTNGNYSTAGISSWTYGNVNAGITNSGSIRGMYSEVFRNAFGTADNGTMTSIFGNRMLYGHFNNDVAATPITTNVYGLFLYPFAKTGTITNLYDLYIANPNSGGIVTNHWALYQNDVTAKNYFAGNLGIATTTPSYKLHVGDGTTVGIIARFQNSTGTCDINPTTTSLSCSSDRTLKTNITNLNNTILNQITTLQPVTYTWINDNTNQQQTGFIAQDVEAIFPSLVSTDPTTNLKSLNYIGLIPYAIEGIKEIDIKVNQLSSLDDTVEGSFASILKSYLANASNRITRIFTGEVCLTDIDGSSECLNKEELSQLKQLLNNQNNIQQPTPQDQNIETIPPAEPIVEEVVVEENNQNTQEVVE